MKLIGYMAFYFKITLDKEIAYAKWDSDFEELPTQEFVDTLMSGITHAYEDSGLIVISIVSCTKEEYEKEKSDKVLASEKL